MSEPFHIISLEIQNCKRIAAFELDAESGKPIILTGTNGAGKSSVIDGIWLALTNRGVVEPIKKGTDKCVIRLGIGENEVVYKLRRSWTSKGGHSIEIKDEDGKQVKEPQKFLDSLVGELCFDPLELLRQKPKEQLETVKRVLGLDFSDLEEQRAGLYAERTVANRRVKELEAQLGGLPKPSADVPDEEVQSASILDRLSDLEDRLTDIAAHENTEQNCRHQYRLAQQRVADLEAQLARAKELEQAAAKALDDAEAEALAFIDSGPGRDELTTAIAKTKQELVDLEGRNTAVRSKKAYAAKKADLAKAVKEAAKFDSEISDLDTEKAERIRKTKIPVENLTLTNEGIMVGDVRFDQMSTGEQIRISAALAMTQGKKLRIMLIREGALLSAENLAILFAIAKENNFQPWVEMFKESPGEEGIHIIDGAKAYIDGKEVAAA